MSYPLPPNPCLLAIILLVKFHHEPQFVFHYPPRPGEDNSQYKTYLADDLTDDEPSSSSDDESVKSADERSRLNGESAERSKEIDVPEVDVDETGSASPEKHNGIDAARNRTRWNDVFGFESGMLAKLLCPASSAHKKRFEMSIDDKVFLGWPVFKREGRDWQRRKRDRASKSKDNHSEVKVKLQHQEGRTASGNMSAQVISEIDETSGEESALEDQHQKIEGAGYSDDEPTVKDEEIRQDDHKKEERVKTKSKNALNMFHVIFVLNPPPLEHHLRVNQMYDNVVKKFSRALKWEQARSDYVAREALNLSSLSYDSANHPLAPLYHKLLSQSSLAKAISTLYNSVSSSRIAHVSLTPTLSLSLQIPIPTSTSVLPTPISPQLSGLWLTTATSLPTDDDINMTGSQLAAHFTLLLLSDLHTILSDVNATDSPLTTPLTHYLRVSKSTKSFLQISQSSGIPLPDIQFLASHLIYWRRARAIPPLHQRDTYIVSPNADMRKLASSSSTFARKFPTLPSLPKILNMLSFTPRPYSTLIPSKDHKEAYLDILAWLLRGGWVTQLRTFAWVRVPNHIKASVTAEQKEPSKPKPSRPFSTEEQEKTDPSSNSGPPSPTSSTHTTLPFHPSTSSSAQETTLPSLLPNPHLASGLHSHHLSAISAHIRSTRGEEEQAAWNKCVRYFDGKHAVETIAISEGWKRKRVGELVQGWEGEGVLVRGKFW